MVSVQDYVDKQDKGKKGIIEKLRKLVKSTIPNIKEEMQWGVICYENMYYIAALKNQVNFGFSIMGLGKDDAGLFEGTGKTMRHVKISAPNFDEKALVQKILLVRKKAKPVHG